MTKPHKLSRRLLYFALIGTSAASVHLLTVLLLVSYCSFTPLIANIFGFLIAFCLSFIGHRSLTFARLQNEKHLSLPHYFLVACSAGGMNELLYFFVLHYTHLNYLVALTLVLATISVYSFLMAKLWACR